MGEELEEGWGDGVVWRDGKSRAGRRERFARVCSCGRMTRRRRSATRR